MTQIGGAVGTPYYCTPESYKGGVCLASDIWSFVIVMIELFGGTEMIGLIICKTLPLLDHLKTQIKDVCSMCLNYNPKQ